MSWFRGDDRLHAHRKTRAVLRSHPDKTRDASPMGLWVLAGTWAAQNATVGWAPIEELDRWDDDWQDLAARLVDAGFWWPEIRGGEQGFGFVNWEEYNPSAGQPSDSGTYGNHVRWHVKRKMVAEHCEHCPSEPESVPESPIASGGIAPDIAAESGCESQTIAQPNPIPTPTQPIPSPLASAAEIQAPSTELALIPVSAVAPTKKPTMTKGTRLPDGWIPARIKSNLDAEAGHDAAWLSRELERFRDHWAAAAGSRGVRTNWDSTWRNWLKTAEDRQRGNGRPRTASSMDDGDWAIHLENARRADERNAS